MGVIEKLLAILSKDSENYSNKEIEMTKQKNRVIEAKNILTLNRLQASSITYSDILRLPDEDLKCLIRCCYPDDVTKQKIAEIKTAISIIKMYEKLKSKFGDIANATQQETSINTLNNFIIQIKRIIMLPIAQIVDETVPLSKQLLDKFTGEQIIEPFFSFQEINEFIKELEPEERTSIKQELYNQTYNLVLKSKNKNASYVLAKYYAVLGIKKQKYKAAYDLIKDEEFALQEAIDYIPLFAEKYSLDFVSTKQAMTVVLLERYLKEYEEILISDESEDFKEEYLSTLVNQFEEILSFSRKHETKKKNKEKPEQKQSEKSQMLDLSVIESAKKIINQESNLIYSVSADDLTNYLGQSINDNSAESLKYKIISILIEISNIITPLERALEASNGNPSKELAQKINEIKNYLSVYYDLKKMLEQEQTKEPDKEDKQLAGQKILFLTDNSGKSIIEEEIALAEKVYSNDLLKLVKKIVDGNFSGVKSMEIDAFGHKTYRIQNRSSRISYLMLPNNYILVLCSAVKSEDITGKTKKIIGTKKQSILDIFKQMTNKETAEILFDQQAQIRDNLKLTNKKQKNEKVSK